MRGNGTGCIVGSSHDSDIFGAKCTDKDPTKGGRPKFRAKYMTPVLGCCGSWTEGASSGWASISRVSGRATEYQEYSYRSLLFSVR